MATVTQHILMLLAVVKAIQCACYSRTITASGTRLYKSHYPSSNYEDCTFTIIPPSYYTRKHYLEITWSTFNVNGDMPNCYGGDYVEVKLTRYIIVFRYVGNSLNSIIISSAGACACDCCIMTFVQNLMKN